jgi:peptidoglycan/xylan/chitin deacetylase (PgdA/CDA1 family)
MMRRLLILLWFALSALAAPAAAEDAKRIALTFDDVPRHTGAFLTDDERTSLLVEGLREAGVEQAAFFVTTGNLDTSAGGVERIARYVAAGHVLANHTHSHRHLSEVSAEDYLADIDRAAAWLATQPASRPWMRFPYLDEGRDQRDKRETVRAGLAARGLSNGVVTIDASDWKYDDLATRAKAAGKPIDMAALGELWVESHVEAAEFYDDLARRTLGRSPAHVMLLHEADVTALYVVDLVAALRARGWQVITADEAFADPVARMLPEVPSAQGTITEMIAWERGFSAPRWYARNSEALATAEFERRVLADGSAADEGSDRPWAGPGRFCGYSPIIDLREGETVERLTSGVHGGNFRWTGEFGEMEVGGIGWASKPRGRALKGRTGTGQIRFASRRDIEGFVIAIWNGRQGAAYFRSPRHFTREQLSAIDRVDLFQEGEEPKGCKYRTIFVSDF